VGPQYPGTELWETQYQFCIFYIISLIINTISITSVISKIFNIQFVSVSPCSSFFPSSGGSVGVNREHLPLSLLPSALNSDRYTKPWRGFGRAEIVTVGWRQITAQYNFVKFGEKGFSEIMDLCLLL